MHKGAHTVPSRTPREVVRVILENDLLKTVQSKLGSFGRLERIRRIVRQTRKEKRIDSRKIDFYGNRRENDVEAVRAERNSKLS